MKVKSFALLCAKLLVLVAMEAAALSCPPCEELTCRTPTSCRGGKVRDICGCCMTCAKVEGEACGGQWRNQGRCDTHLSCVYRDKTRKGGIGRCEPVECKDKTCGFRQVCSLSNLGQPQCTCPRQCKSSKGRPVCGHSNGRQYDNACDLYRHECKEQVEIGLMPGPCKKCHYSGKAYKFGEVRGSDDPCEKCACVHGEWKCAMKPNCRQTFMACTTFRDVNGQMTSTCPKGQWCKVQIPGIASEGIPDVAVCVPGASPSTTPLTQTTVKKQPRIVDAEVPPQCRLRPAEGPCRAAFKRWYYNPEKNKCFEFTYGGCDGNANNFNNKDACTAFCASKFIEIEQVPDTTTPKPTEKPAEVISAKEWNRICQKPPETGKCRAALVRWFYNPTSRKCVKFIYGGCGGNRNNFETKERCKISCYRRRVPIHLTSTSSMQLRTPVPINPDIQAIEARQPTPGMQPATFRCRDWNGKQIECFTACFHAVTNNPDGSQDENYGCVANTISVRFSCVNITSSQNQTVFVKCCSTNMCNALPLMNMAALRNRRTDLLENQTMPTEEELIPKCYDENSNRAHGEGEEWKPNDCTVCKCHKGTPECVATVCRHPDCMRPVRIKGQCCPACPVSSNRSRDAEIIQALARSQLGTVLVSINDAEDKGVCTDLRTGQLYLVGQTWQLDECTTCFCGKHGRTACAVKMCDRLLKCKNPVKVEGQCCLVCRDEAETSPKCFDSITKDYYSVGEMWRRDDCTHCKCGPDFTPQCSRTRCQALDCQAPVSIQGRCCPVCPGTLQKGCIYEKKSFLHGDWKLLPDHCTLCECQNSAWVCSGERCQNSETPSD